MPLVKVFTAAVLKVLDGNRCSDTKTCSEVGVVKTCSDKGGFTPAP